MSYKERSRRGKRSGKMDRLHWSPGRDMFDDLKYIHELIFRSECVTNLKPNNYDEAVRNGLTLAKRAQQTSQTHLRRMANEKHHG